MNRSHGYGARCKTVERSCAHAIIKAKEPSKRHGGEWFFFEFRISASGDYLIKEAIYEVRQWRQYSKRPRMHWSKEDHIYRAARLHAVKAIEAARREFGDQGELF